MRDQRKEPTRSEREIAAQRKARRDEIAWSHRDDPEDFGAVLPCGDATCRHPRCPSGGKRQAVGEIKGHHAPMAERYVTERKADKEEGR